MQPVGAGTNRNPPPAQARGFCSSGRSSHAFFNRLIRFSLIITHEVGNRLRGWETSLRFLRSSYAAGGRRHKQKPPAGPGEGFLLFRKEFSCVLYPSYSLLTYHNARGRQQVAGMGDQFAVLTIFLCSRWAQAQTETPRRPRRGVSALQEGVLMRSLPVLF